MCLAIPGKVVKITEKTCVVDIMGAEREASTELLDGVKVGDYVLVHAGCAIQKMDEQEALDTIRMFEEMKDIAHE
ncbi:hydrogenase assembly protein HypC [Clostridium thermosuccinogenes]|jgi:hydrogenase expression/formation protein HypC|uniref:Hydrogenase assembly protein HypC n=1 Tax=Clostridium thermosuccinogenes TaxID=84032 RepID=A0A2K2F3A8_9CLOT|nr:HypC/HybG/HupF family hydrogenase formation chaperone [Pseudoclostridium thermosuccinogenes]AUS96032.1 hydrogenase assembly protein HypC [Pseudoclostridium thermosuccinogenes]PNT93244.1 hydrogenase assembly protein HypC [Pseudoclostridium thermosuccinogenes]PNT99421.1 hydrogenase assembly protein HypC [Pseudoclostridium thermosuccinogenes]PNU01108.1 hydrogenase assembly protein HypC [Pseudoclostridium thermosuccinogenes]